MRYTNIDGNMAALAKYEAKYEEESQMDELREQGAAEKLMVDQVTAMAEEFITEGALTLLIRGGEWSGMLLTDMDTATTMLEDAMLAMAKIYDTGEKA
jgi:hypothetical protein